MTPGQVVIAAALVVLVVVALVVLGVRGRPRPIAIGLSAGCLTALVLELAVVAGPWTPDCAANQCGGIAGWMSPRLAELTGAIIAIAVVVGVASAWATVRRADSGSPRET